jgi:hypothetical protein
MLLLRLRHDFLDCIAYFLKRPLESPLCELYMSILHCAGFRNFTLREDKMWSFKNAFVRKPLCAYCHIRRLHIHSGSLSAARGGYDPLLEDLAKVLLLLINVEEIVLQKAEDALSVPALAVVFTSCPRLINSTL